MTELTKFPMAREIVLRNGNTQIGVMPEICLVSHFQVNNWPSAVSRRRDRQRETLGAAPDDSQLFASERWTFQRERDDFACAWFRTESALGCVREDG